MTVLFSARDQGQHEGDRAGADECEVGFIDVIVTFADHDHADDERCDDDVSVGESAKFAESRRDPYFTSVPLTVEGHAESAALVVGEGEPGDLVDDEGGDDREDVAEEAHGGVLSSGEMRGIG